MSTESPLLSSLEANLTSTLVAKIRDFAIFMLSPDGRVATWNAGAQRAKGYAADEIIGQHFECFYTEEDRAAGVPRQALATAQSAGVFEATGWRVRKDGSRFWAHVVIDPLYDDDGTLIGFGKVTRDVTKARDAREREARAQAALLQARTEQSQHLLRLFEQAPGFVCYFNGPEHVYELQNDAHHRLAGYRDIIGKPVREALPELAGQGFFELLDEVYASGKPYVGRAVPLTLRSADGKDVGSFIDFVYQPIFDENGKVLGIVSQGSDVTEQVNNTRFLAEKQAELERTIVERTGALEETRKALALANELQLSNTFFHSLFEQAPGFICVLKGPEHVFELANNAYRNLTGNRDLIGKTVREALPDVDGQGFFELLDKVFQNGTPVVGQSVQLELQEGPGRIVTRFIDFIYQPILNAQGESVGIFVQGSDVTKQKLAQDEVQKYQKELESLVEARTTELQTTQAALQHSQKLEAIGKLTGGVAHDFNNILQVIGGNLQLLRDLSAGASLPAKHIDTALRAVERGAKLASQLLAFARRQPLQPVVINPARIVQQMDELLRRALGETTAVETIRSGGLWNTCVDPYQLENVILNLAINARDAMPPSGGKLTIELGNAMLDDEYAATHHEITPGQYVMIAVSDNGYGMSKEVLERACEPFFTTKPEGHGTGLGLSMAYGFVKQTGGHFKIYSEVGHGTTIKMYFPRSYKAEVSEPIVKGGPVTGGNETILVVEDDLAVQATVVEMLRSLGYKVMKADNAASALVILNSGMPVDLLFTDVVMPGEVRSPELARQARQLHPNIEVLFTSGYTQNAIVHDGKLDAGVQLLSKPYGKDQLARKVRQLLSKQPAQPARTADAAPIETVAGTRRVLFVEDDPDLLATTCSLLELLNQRVDGTADPAEALALLQRSHYDVLITDYELPGMSGAELARRAKAIRPGLQLVVATGYGHVEEAAALGALSLPKPFSPADLKRILEA
ncbi:PAS domain-containing protein [Massilia consociata]|uniref:histidine kinase n=1 Tax=Massilia consociata TaxID=760117 RepID=A0ABV6FCM6_9BURK